MRATVPVKLVAQVMLAAHPLVSHLFAGGIQAFPQANYGLWKLATPSTTWFQTQIWVAVDLKMVPNTNFSKKQCSLKQETLIPSKIQWIELPLNSNCESSQPPTETPEFFKKGKNKKTFPKLHVVDKFELYSNAPGTAWGRILFREKLASISVHIWLKAFFEWEAA